MQLNQDQIDMIFAKLNHRIFVETVFDGSESRDAYHLSGKELHSLLSENDVPTPTVGNRAIASQEICFFDNGIKQVLLNLTQAPVGQAPA